MVFLAFLFSFITAGFAGIVIGIMLDEYRYYSYDDEVFDTRVDELKKRRELYLKRYEKDGE